ncbi:hypothetical protein HanRHA438_Chr17g0819211 [Helianthus annuus]|nr:hypothetical protein HanIR_Chr17g0878301 [Helianthus annuus]KAJ0826874.1 hypothetical protein HanRHA438_Chr17g0819211 [Helianthus annuus]
MFRAFDLFQRSSVRVCVCGSFIKNLLPFSGVIKTHVIKVHLCQILRIFFKFLRFSAVSSGCH